MGRNLLIVIVILVLLIAKVDFCMAVEYGPSIDTAVTILNGDSIAENTTITSTGSINIGAGVTFTIPANYHLTIDIPVDLNVPQINVSGTLIIESGVILTFNSALPASKIVVNSSGNLQIGTAVGNRVQLISTSEPLIGWQGIDNKGIVLIQNTLIKSADSGVNQDNGTTNIEGSVIDSCGSGIKINGGSVNITNNNFVSNTNSIDLANGINSIIHNNTFSNNSSAIILLKTNSLIFDNTFDNNESAVILHEHNIVDIRANNFGAADTIVLENGSMNTNVSIMFNNFYHNKSISNSFYIIQNQGTPVTVYNSYWSNTGEPGAALNEAEIRAAELVSGTVFINNPLTSEYTHTGDSTYPELVEVNPTKGAVNTDITLTVVLTDVGWGINPATFSISFAGPSAVTVSNYSHIYNNRQYIFSATARFNQIGDYNWQIDASDIAGNPLTDPRNILSTSKLNISISINSATSKNWSTWTQGVYNLITVPVAPYEKDQKAALKLTAPDTAIADFLGGTSYIYYGDPGFETHQFTPGKGFWLKLGTNEAIEEKTVTGDVQTDLSLGLVLSTGWHLIGNPFWDKDILDFNHLSVTYLKDGKLETHSYIDAVIDGVVSFGLWGYNSPNYYFERNNLEAWKGYWIHAKTECTLNFYRSVYGSTGSSMLNWDLQLTASQSQMNDGANYLGLARTAQAGVDIFDSVKPPAVTAGLKSYFMPVGSGGQYGTDFRSASSKVEKWHFVVTGLVPGEARITWNGLSNIPKDYQLIIKDLKTGKETDLRRNNAYSFNISTESQREFEIVMNAQSTPLLQITELSLSPNPFAPLRETIQINYKMSDSASVEMRIYDWVGNLVYVYPGSMNAIGGVLSHFPWNGRNNLGKMVANGIYFCKIAARSSMSQTSAVLKIAVVN